MLSFSLEQQRQSISAFFHTADHFHYKIVHQQKIFLFLSSSPSTIFSCRAALTSKTEEVPYAVYPCLNSVSELKFLL